MAIDVEMEERITIQSQDRISSTLSDRFATRQLSSFDHHCLVLIEHSVDVSDSRQE
jgi:hypothetical protein